MNGLCDLFPYRKKSAFLRRRKTSRSTEVKRMKTKLVQKSRDAETHSDESPERVGIYLDSA